MPLYLYRCLDCGSEEEILQKFSDPPATECESCQGRLQKVITAAAFHLKGGGWYKDLYASAKPDSGSKAEGDGGKKSEGEGKAKAKADKSGSGSSGSGAKAAAE